MGSSLVRRVLLGGVVVAALGAFVFAFTLGGDRSQDATVTDSAVEGRSPAPNAQVLNQAAIEIDLATGWTGVLQVNGAELPPDQLNCLDNCDVPLCDPDRPPSTLGRACRVFADPQSRVYFVPDEGKAIETLGTGPVCVNAVIWREVESREQSRDVPWCFRVTA